MLSADEREKLWLAMNRLKATSIDNITIWDLHTLVHYPDSAPGAHWGPAFLPWHREFLRQFEVALQREVPSVSLPYWDSTLDEADEPLNENIKLVLNFGNLVVKMTPSTGSSSAGLPDPSDSVMWSDELLGNGNGYVKTGPFQNWDTNVLMPLSRIPVKKLYRSTGGREQDRLMSPSDVEWITSRKNYSQLTFCHDKTFESMHGLSHVWVGGFMFVIRRVVISFIYRFTSVSPNDPMFYLHHAFVDYLWEQFRKKQQSREQRETQWAQDTCNELHGYDEQMKPFRLQNRDGLSNQYTDEWYDYEPVRHCMSIIPECDSPYYWCDTKSWRCRSKVVLGGNCTGFEGTGICYNSVCQQNRCQLPPRIQQSMRLRKSIDSIPGEIVWTKSLLVDQNGDGTVFFIHPFVTFQEVTFQGTVYLPVPKPRAGIIQEVTLEARDAYGRYCQAHCYNTTEERYQVR
uniref:Tyrosinase_Cu-bd domain-containing protein n=1 Tax=Angiostrongylus cantonensis TaxID=6313 RepID=A0A158P6C4_ANGCA